MTLNELRLLADVAGREWTSSGHHVIAHRQTSGRIQLESWRPHEDIAQAFEVVDAVLESNRNWILHIVCTNHGDENRQRKLCAGFHLINSPVQTDSVQHELKPMAICLAVLQFLAQRDDLLRKNEEQYAKVRGQQMLQDLNIESRNAGEDDSCPI